MVDAENAWKKHSLCLEGLNVLGWESGVLASNCNVVREVLCQGQTQGALKAQWMGKLTSGGVFVCVLETALQRGEREDQVWELPVVWNY